MTVPGNKATAAIDVQGLAFAYPDGHRALDGIDLRIMKGERVALFGPNGAGKTTMALHLNGIHEVQVGSVTIGGMKVVGKDLAEIRRRVGMVFQNTDDQLFMSTVREDVAFGPANMGMAGADLDTRVQEALDMVGARSLADRAPHHLSGGEKRRVALATVLSMQPDMLVLDEPTSGLDPAGRRELAQVLTDLDTTHVIITHDLPFALELCDRAVVLNAGRITADRACVEVLRDTELLQANRLELPLGFDPDLGLARRTET